MIFRAAQGLVQHIRLISKSIQPASSQKDIINTPSWEYVSSRSALKANIWRDLDPTGLVLL